MTPAESLQYLATVANDFLRTLPPSAQGPTGGALQECVATLARAIEAPPADVMLDASHINGDAREGESRAKKNPAGETQAGH